MNGKRCRQVFINMKTLLNKLIREEFKSVLKEQAGEADIQKFADRVNANVSINMLNGNNKLKFIQTQDVDEKTFEMFIKFLQKIGYDVDMGYSTRDYENDGDRKSYPQIVFK